MCVRMPKIILVNMNVEKDKTKLAIFFGKANNEIILKIADMEENQNDESHHKMW